MLQYLIDFLIIRKNQQLDLLNFSFEDTMAPTIKSEAEKSEYSASKEKDDRKVRPNEFAYDFVSRPTPIYQQAGDFHMNLKFVLNKCRMSATFASKLDKRPFDNNILNGRRIARRLAKSSSREERMVPQQLDHNQNNLNNKTAKETIQPLIIASANQHARPSPINSATIVLTDNDTPPLSDVSSTHSPGKVQIISNHVVNPPIISSAEPRAASFPTQIIPVSQPRITSAEGVKNNVVMESELHKQIKNGQLTLQELRTLSQNGTEIIPTSVVKPAALAQMQQSTPSPNPSLREMRKIYEQQQLQLPSYEDTQPRSFRVQKMPMRRKSCHERIVHENSAKTNQIGEQFTIFYNNNQNGVKLMAGREREMKQVQDIRPARPEHYYPGEVKKARYDTGAPPVYAQHRPQPQQQLLQANHPTNGNIQMQPQPQQQHRENINYLQYEEYFRKLQKLGLPPAEILHNPMEIVSNIHPEQYANRRQHQEAMFHRPRVQSTQQQQHRLYQQQHQEMERKAIAMQQLQELRRDPSNLPPQKYAEHLKQMENLKSQQRMRDEQYQIQQQHLHTRNKYVVHPSYIVNNKPANGNSSHEDYVRKVANFEYDESQNLQRKLKNKSRSVTNYREPSNQAQVTSKPIVVNQNPPHSTYYSDPQIRNKSSTASSPQQNMMNAFYFVENGMMKSPQRPIPIREHPVAPQQPQHHQMQPHPAVQNWHIAQNVLERTSQLMQSHLDPKIPNGAHISPTHYPAEQPDQPTQFLREFYSEKNRAGVNQKNY